MDKSAFGAVAYDFSDPTVQGAKRMTSTADEYTGNVTRKYLTAAFSGVMVPIDPKILAVQASLIQKGYVADIDTLAKVQADDPGGDWSQASDAMSDYYSGGAVGASYPSQESFLTKYKNYLIAGTALVGGLGLIWYLRK